VVEVLLAAAVTAACASCGRLPKIIVLHDPLSAQEHLALGVAYEREGKLDLAEREYRRAVRKDPGLVQARINMGNVRVARKDFAGASRWYLDALRLSPGHPEAVNNLAWAAIGSQDPQALADAQQRLEAVLADPSRRTATLLDTLGVLLARRGRVREAQEILAEALRACGPECDPAERAEIEEHRRQAQDGPAPGPGSAPLVE